MVKINEFHDMDIPQEIIPKPDYDVPSDLLIFMRNDPMFYRKNFFPAVEKYKENTKDTAPLENMVKRGLGEYCNKFKIENPKEELMGEGDMIDLVRQIIADEMEELDEGVKHFFARNFSGDAQFKAWMRTWKEKGPKKAEAMVGPRLHKEFKEKAGWNE